MKIAVTKRYECENVISTRDERVFLLVDNTIKVSVILCNDKHHRMLGNIRLEEVTIDEDTYFSKNFNELPEEYSQDILEEKIAEFLIDN